MRCNSRISSLKYLSICSGIEAASVAWKPLGWEALAFSEIDKFPSAVLKHHYPSVPNLGDITKFKEWKIEPIDLLVGGTPCQSFSVAGLRKGMDDPRGNLALVFLSILDQTRPRWMVWENVPGVLSSKEGRDFGSFLGALGQLGYGWAYRVLDAQYFGVPQRRRRVFVVGYFGDWRRAAAVLFESQSLSGDSPPSRKKGEGNAPTISKCLEARGGSGRCDPTAEEFVVTHSLRADGFGASEDGTGRGTPIIPFDTTNITSKANRSNPKAGDPCHTLAKGLNVPSITYPIRAGRRIADSHGNAGNDVPGVYGVRRLTPRECERLQGFPDDYTLIPYNGKLAADGPRHKALGNSMAVPVMRWIGERIKNVEEIK